VAVLLLFAAAREAAGTGREVVGGATVGEVLDDARRRHGELFAKVLDASRVWRNGEPAGSDEPVGPDDEVAVLPPVSGGAVAPGSRRTAASAVVR
jgi:molybdopterin converting factor small subunit